MGMDGLIWSTGPCLQIVSAGSQFGLFCLNYGLVLAEPQTPYEPAFLSTVAAGETLNWSSHDCKLYCTGVLFLRNTQLGQRKWQLHRKCSCSIGIFDFSSQDLSVKRFSKVISVIRKGIDITFDYLKNGLILAHCELGGFSFSSVHTPPCVGCMLSQYFIMSWSLSHNLPLPTPTPLSKKTF